MLRRLALALVVVGVSGSMPYILYRYRRIHPIEMETRVEESGGPPRAPAPPPAGPFGKVGLEEEPQFDFGRMAFGGTGRRVFALENVG